MPPEPVQVAFRVYGTDWGMRGHGSRQIDWLVDGKVLHRDNVLFVIDQPISKAYKLSLEEKYRVYDATNWCSPWLTRGRRWDKFLKYWAPHHWVSYNDYHPRHICRNRILRAAGCQTWHYSHSVNLPHVHGQPNYEPWMHLDYDHLVCWCDMDAAAFAGGEKHILGPLFSSQVAHTVVAVFDSTYGNYPAGTAAAFYKYLLIMLDQNPDMIMLFKPKHVPAPTLFHPRLYILPPWIDPALVIACSKVTIGLAYTSPVVEAWGAGKEAYWFDPHRNIPIARNMEYGDGLAANRFRELLTK